MNQYVLLLRGVNVGGVKIPMRQLAACLQDAGFASVRTVLATGNAVFDAAGEPQRVLERAATALAERFGRAVPALLYGADAFAALAAADFPLEVPDGPHHRYLSFTPDAAAARALAADLAGAVAADPPDPADAFAVNGPVLYWFTARGTSTSSTLATALQRLSRRHLLTTRNLNTVQRIAVLLRSGDA